MRVVNLTLIYLPTVHLSWECHRHLKDVSETSPLALPASPRCTLPSLVNGNRKTHLDVISFPISPWTAFCLACPAVFSLSWNQMVSLNSPTMLLCFTPFRGQIPLGCFLAKKVPMACSHLFRLSFIYSPLPCSLCLTNSLCLLCLEKSSSHPLLFCPSETFLSSPFWVNEQMAPPIFF